MSMAKAMIIGNLGRDAELKYLPSGTPVLEFSVATNERWKDKNDQQQERTQWFRVSLFGRRGEALKQYLTRGKTVFVEGRLRTSEWTDRNEEKRFGLDIIADTIEFMGGGRGSDAPRDAAAPPKELDADDASYSDDEIPF